MEDNAEKIWDQAKEHLKGMLNAEIYTLWFESIQVVKMDERCLTLLVANEFTEVWVKDNYLGLLQDVIGAVSGRRLEIELQVSDRSKPEAELAIEVEVAKAPARPAKSKSAEAEAASEVNPFNPNYTFDSFVIGDNSQFAHAASLAVAQRPGKAYNPLYLYSGVGLGKTHLLHAIGQYVAQSSGTKRKPKVTYVSTEKFTNEYIEALQNNDLPNFRKRYRQSEVLLIDDVQFLAGKERIQEEFFHTFNALHESHRQIVLTCDRPSNEIQGLEKRLVSRFEWGMVVDLQPPSVETRLAILRKKAELLGADLPDAILMLLANRIRANIRRLEGALTRVASYAAITGNPLSTGRVEALLRDLLSEESRAAVNIDVIQKKVAEHYDLRLQDMTSHRRPENIAFPRQIAMYLSRKLTEQSLNSIGQAFGGRDHGTVMHACKVVEGRMDVDSNVRQVVSYLEQQLQR